MSTTPGPWRYEASTKTIRSEPTNYWLASMNSWDGAVDHEANAALITAAPELAAENDRLRHTIRCALVVLEEYTDNRRVSMTAAIDGLRAGLARGEG